MLDGNFIWIFFFASFICSRLARAQRNFHIIIDNDKLPRLGSSSECCVWSWNSSKKRAGEQRGINSMMISSCYALDVFFYCHSGSAARSLVCAITVVLSTLRCLAWIGFECEIVHELLCCWVSREKERVKRNDEKLPTLETAKARNCNQLNIIALSLSLTLLTHSFASSRPPLSASLSSHVIFHHILLRVTQKITNHHLFFRRLSLHAKLTRESTFFFWFFISYFVFIIIIIVHTVFYCRRAHFELTSSHRHRCCCSAVLDDDEDVCTLVMLKK